MALSSGLAFLQAEERAGEADSLAKKGQLVKLADCPGSRLAARTGGPAVPQSRTGHNESGSVSMPAVTGRPSSLAYLSANRAPKDPDWLGTQLLVGGSLEQP